MPELGLFGYDDSVVWLVVGLVLCGAETLAPGAFVIFVGAAALILGVVEFLWPLPPAAQLLLFAALVVALVASGRRLYGSFERRAPASAPGRAEGLVGKEFFLDQPIEHGFGNIRVADSVWRVTGEDMGAGVKVRVTGVEEGALLRVAKA
ncbi:MAG: NfeD family protein [Roseiarcus sp.]